MSGSFRPPRSPNIIWSSFSSSITIHYGRQWPEMLSRPKKHQIYEQILHEFGWKVFNYQATYIQNLAPGDFHLFLHLKKFLSGQHQHFQNDRKAEKSDTVVPISGVAPVVQWLSYSPLDPRFVGSIPAGVDGFFQSVEILSMTSFGKEVKPWVPCCKFTAHKRTSSQN